jgi:hypothetical protein
VNAQDLEIVSVPGDAAPAAPARRRRRRWPWAVGGAAAVLAALLFPVRTALAQAEVDHLQASWAVLVALESSRSTLINRLISESVSSDATALRRAAIGLDQEEAARVTALRRSLPAIASLDHGASALRTAVARAFDQELAGLHASISSLRRGDILLPSQLSATTVDFETVDDQVTAQRRRFGEDLHDQHRSTAALHAADAALTAFGHFADAPIGARLLVTTNFGVRILDVDRSTDTAVDLGPETRVVVVGDAVFALSGRELFRLPAGVSGPRQDLGPAAAVFPAGGGRGLWITMPDGQVALRTLSGQLSWGPQSLQAGPLGAVDAGVVVGTPPTTGLGVVNPAAGVPVRQITSSPVPPVLLGATGDLVAYTHNHDASVHVVSVSTGAVRSYPILAPGTLESGVGALSPDGRWLATYAVGTGAAASSEPVIVDLQSGAVVRLQDVSNPDPQLSLSWTPDSSRLFFTVNEDGATVATWRVGDPTATVLRWRSGTAGTVTVLP